MEDAILQIVYRSKHTQGLSRSEIEALGVAGRTRAEKLGLTGFMISQGETFVEVLEGPAGTVIDRLEEISEDGRHTEMRILRESEVDRPRFGAWYFGNLTSAGNYPGATEDGEAFADTLSRNLQRHSD